MQLEPVHRIGAAVPLAAGAFPRTLLLLAVFLATLAACSATSGDPAEGSRGEDSAWATIVDRGHALIRRFRGFASDDASGAADTAIVAPELTGVLANGEPFDLRSWRGAPVVLIFFRGEDCGLCMHRLRQLEENLDAYHGLGARVAAIFAGDAGGAARIAGQTAVRADVVAVARERLETWDVWPAGESAARPAAAIVDSRGHIVYSHVGSNANDRVPDVDLIAELARLAEGDGQAVP